jgi:bifunctional oligoribonuclease and PAP phosphatase NrnA
MSIDWRPFVELVKRHESFVLTSHMRPDCDAIGSELGMAHALRSLGKQVRIVNGDPVPPHITFIDPQKNVSVLGSDVSADELRPQVFIILDTSAWSQLGPMADVVRKSSALKVVVDHHISQDDMSAEVYKDTASEATGRLVYSGASPRDIFAALYERNSLARLKLQGRILLAVKTDCAGKLIYSAATPTDLAETGAEATDTEDVVNRLLGVAGVEVALLFLEIGPQETKVSLRSRTTFDVRAIAAQFGGGGHTAASGVRYPGPLDKAVAAVVDAVRKALG